MRRCQEIFLVAGIGLKDINQQTAICTSAHIGAHNMHKSKANFAIRLAMGWSRFLLLALG
jgi:hypothetical protein